ncbi:hypothetical protein KC845_04065, partial [Candidatus Kaiserbacteria bacterium]|nr:hypothetical protein [Candidatus Kaiserbacteria bacterium]
MLPTFWDIETSLENETFEVEVSLPYSEELLSSYDATPQDLIVQFYNKDTNYWEPQLTNINQSESTASFTTSHFSRYALSVVKEEPEPELTIDELFEQLQEAVRSSDLRSLPKYLLKKQIQLIKKFVDRDTKSSKKVAKKLLNNLEKKLKLYERLYRVDLVEAKDLVGEIKDKAYTK